MELDELRQKVLLMASRAETAVNQSMQALINRDHDLTVLVCGNDEIIDLLEVEIDQMAILLLTKAPLASDLRLVTVAMKVSQNLERIGDEATKIAKRARDIAREPALTVNFEINRMADMTIRMVKDALDAFCSFAIPPLPAVSSFATRKWTHSIRIAILYYHST